MHNKILLLFSAVSLLAACSNTAEKQSITLNHGLFMDTATRRYGIEVTNDTVFYCEEQPGTPVRYSYYYSKEDTNIDSLAAAANNLFDESLHYNEEGIADATLCQLQIKRGAKLIQVNFFEELLTGEQLAMINKIDGMKKHRFYKMRYHQFPQDMLFQKLPPPPPVE